MGRLLWLCVAQLGFSSSAADPPFAGRKGKLRLAVLDGVADVETVRAVVSRLGVSRTGLCRCESDNEPEAEALIGRTQPGITLRKAPSDLLRWRVTDDLAYRTINRSSVRSRREWTLRVPNKAAVSKSFKSLQSTTTTRWSATSLPESARLTSWRSAHRLPFRARNP